MLQFSLRSAAALALALGLISGVAAAQRLTLEPGIDRPGSDYFSFDLATADPEACRAACSADAQCQAFTYVEPGVQGPSARCWLKDAQPDPRGSDCCVSGAREPEITLVFNIDRPGGDYRSFDMTSPDPEACQSACLADSQCQAFTYVSPGVQGASARCWLKDTQPEPVSNTCCASGVRNY